MLSLHSEQLFAESTVLDLLPVAVYVCEAPSGRIRRYNRRAAELWGRAPKLGDTESRFCGCHQLYWPDGQPLPHHQTPMAQVLRGGPPIRDGVVIIEHPGGSRVWVQVNIDPLYDREGRLVGAVNVFQDITERRRAEDRAKLQRLTASFSAASTPQDVAETIAQVGGPAAEARSASVLLADGAPSRLHALGGARELEFASQAPVSEVARSGRARFYESPARLAAAFAPGPHSPASRSGALALIPLGLGEHCLGVLAFEYAAPRVFSPEAREFLELLAQLAAQALDRARLLQIARDAVQVRDDFLSMASHELRTPLTALQLQVSATLRSLERRLEELPESGRDLRQWKHIERQALRLGKLIDELLDVTRITAGRLSLEPGEVSLDQVIRQVVDRLGPQIELAGSSVDVHCPEGLVGHWDELRLEQVVVNLLTNALKYGGGRPIELEAGAEGRVAWLRVRDHGMGIEPEAQSRIFDRFERATSARGQGGLGLGLWITRSIVEAHGGDIRVESQLGDGAAFTVELPLGTPAPWEAAG